MCLSMLFGGGAGAALAAGQVRIVGLRAVCFECRQEGWGFVCLSWRSHYQDAVRCPFLLVVSSDMCVAEENKEQENEMRDLQQRPAAGGGSGGG